MSGQVTITQLPTAAALTGSEAVPVVQSGVTVQTTTGAISGAGALNYPFLTVGSTAGLNQARYLAATTGLSLTDNGSGGTLAINMTGAASSLNAAGNGILVKDSASTVINRQLTVGSGMTIANADGVSANPLIGVNTNLQNLSSLTGTGLMIINGSTFSQTSLVGTTNQISIANGNASAGNPTIAISSNPVLPGVAGVSVPSGTTANRAVSPPNGTIRYNTDTNGLEGYIANAWNSIVAGGVTAVTAGTGLDVGAGPQGTITSTGTLNLANTAVTAASYGSSTDVGTFTVNAQGQLTAAANVAISAVSIGAVTAVNGTANEITSTGTSTVTLSLPTALTFTGKTVTNGAFNMTSATVGADTVTTNTAAQTLTNKVISGATNTLSNIGNASLTNSSLTVGTTAIALGASSLTLGGLTSVAVTQDPVSALELATKQYVDAVAQGLDPKASCVVATTANITLSGTQTIDSVVLIAGDRCLVKDQTLSQDNGIYLVASGAWTRATDMDTWAEVPGAFTFIEQGTLYADTGWVCTSNAGGTLGTTPITWVQFAGVGSYTAGTGLTLTGTQFSLTAPVPVALGGTNATNDTDARTNLVAAKSGTNSDITELYALNGTSYGVAYQNVSNQLIMGSALTFDGAMLFVPGGISGGTF